MNSKINKIEKYNACILITMFRILVKLNYKMIKNQSDINFLNKIYARLKQYLIVIALDYFC